jgi:vancomycin resistance protein VanJ
MNPDIRKVLALSNLLKQALPEYPYAAFHLAPKFHNIAIFSRFPIESLTILPERSIERGMSAVVKMPGRSVTVIVAQIIYRSWLIFSDG